MLKFKGKVLKVKEEDLELLSKDGVTKVKRHRVMMSMLVDDGVMSIKSYDPTFTIPKAGEMFETPEVRKYENFDGLVAEVML